MDLIEKKRVIDTINLYFALTYEAVEQSDETYDLKIINLLTNLKKGLVTSIETMPSAQSTQNIRVNSSNALDTISRKTVIDSILIEYNTEDSDYPTDYQLGLAKAKQIVIELPSAQPEPLTDKEQRIFLAAMGREEKVCEDVDRNYVREPYEDSLMRVCKEIKRKVKGALWT